MNKNPELHEKNHTSNTLGVFTGLVIGGVAGAVTALLLAPQSGRETRTQIQEKGMELRDQLSEKVEGAVSQVRTSKNKLTTSGRKKAEELLDQGQNLVADQLDRVSEVAQAGKKAIQGSKD